MKPDSNTIKKEDKSGGNEDKSSPSCCQGCVRWEKFGRTCYYYWEGKKHCSMWISSWDDAMTQQPL